MCMKLEERSEIGGLMLRVLFGLVFGFAGLSKVLNYDASVERLTAGMQGLMLPGELVSLVASVIPLAELAIGVMLLIGLFTDLAFMLAGVLLLVLHLGLFAQGVHGGSVHLVIYMLGLVAGWRWLGDTEYSADHYLNKKPKKRRK